MSQQDREKLVTILNNLELDYRAGNISKEKYEYLYERYNSKLEEIEISDRIRTMQSNSNKSTNLKEALSESELEDQELINKFIVRNEKPVKKKKRTVGNGVIIAVATLALLVAFAAGIGFGVFNFDFDANTMSLFGQASISDSAFPVVVQNVTKNVSNYTSSNTNYNYTSYSNSSGNSRGSDRQSSDDDGGSGGRGSSNGSSPLVLFFDIKFSNNIQNMRI